MKANTTSTPISSKASPSIAIVLMLIFFSQGCDPDDPKPVNPEELITTFRVSLVPEGGGDAIELTFYDADGEQGSTSPVITVSSPLASATSYTGVIELINDTMTPVGNISEEVAEEAADHLFCYDVSGDLAISYSDEDENGKPLGLVTTWETGAAGDAAVTITLRHQPGTKTGDCPGGGDTDLQVTFDLEIE